MVPVSEQKLCAGWFLFASSFLLCFVLDFLSVCSPLPTCPHSLFIFLFSSLTSRHLGVPARSAPPTHTSCFRTLQRLPRDYAWVGLNDYIKPRTKSRTLGFGGREAAVGKGRDMVNQWEHDNPSAHPAEMKSRGTTR